MFTLDDLTREAHVRVGTPRWAENAYAADVTLSTIRYLVHNYNQYVDAIKQNSEGTRVIPYIQVTER